MNQLRIIIYKHNSTQQIEIDLKFFGNVVLTTEENKVFFLHLFHWRMWLDLISMQDLCVLFE